MKNIFYVSFVMALLSCSNQKQKQKQKETEKEIPVLKTNAKTVNIEDGNVLHIKRWGISSEVEIDEFVTHKFTGEKNVSFISDIDTLTFAVTPNNVYDFVIQYKEEKAFTRISTDTSKKASMAFENPLEYHYKEKNQISPTDTIPFILGKDSRIYLTGKINDSSPLTILFDTGADAIVISKSSLEKDVKMQFESETQNEGAGGIHTVPFSESNTVEANNLIWDEVPIIAIDYKNRPFDALMGWNAFENKIIEIDYDKQLLIIHNEIKTIPNDFSKIETKMIGNIPYIKGTITVGENNSSGWFEYDSGSDGSFHISAKFATENELNNKMKVVGTSISTGSVGIQRKSTNHILPKIKFDELMLYQVPINIFEEDAEGTEYNDVLGNNLLKRFNAIIDFQNFQIYLKPNLLLHSTY